ncbi:MAG TPA: winged helix-turn-helix domain-containing protein [Edaphobacter sp.]|uniref:winged helix-turn-helix domain-containing protein n=1 Tax=Edaphobacter sp. TaxID=1934404 RepID=UPI002CE29193|nr:winged helix-turn-helix domain-containing protein [Edaphobacter sp.]HUZ93616.1 winged helix-turn-helix domain-containing protein [Edaphobacter sp.]
MPFTESINEVSVRFEGFTVDMRRRGLYRGNERIHLTPTPFKALEFLIRQQGRVVSKDQLLNAVWAGLRDENTVEQAIRQIRLALGDDKDQPRFIQTIPGVGYCFIAELEAEAIPECEPEPIIPTGPADNAPRAEGRTWRLIRKAALPMGIGAFTLLIILILLLQSPSRLAATNPVKITRSQTLVLSPLLNDGTHIAYPQYEDGRYYVAEAAINGGESTTVPTGLPNPELCDVAPDGSAMLLRNLIRSRNDEEPLYVQADGGTAQRLGDIMAYDAAWYPDAKRIIYSADSAVYSTDRAAKFSQRLFNVPGNAFWFRWSPNGKKLRYTVIDKKTEATSIWEVATGIYKPHRLFPKISNHLCCGTWTPDGKFFLLQARVENTFQIWARQEASSFNFIRHDQPFPLIFGAMNYRGPLVSNDGKKLFLRAENPKGELVRYDSKSGEIIPMLPSISVRTLAFSKDGNWIAFTTLTDNNLWRCRSDGTECLELTQGFRNTLMPRWSPDGKMVAFMGLRFTGEWGVFAVQVNGGTIHPLFVENQAEGYPDWSPDGQHLAFSEVVPVARPNGVHVLDLRTNQLSTLPKSTDFYLPRWSPDGRSIVALHFGDQFVYLFDFATSTWRQLTEIPGGYPNWSSDGKAVYFLSNTARGRTVFRVSVADRTIEKVTNFESVDPSPFILGDWMGLAPGDAPLAVQDMTTDDIYAWDLTAK